MIGVERLDVAIVRDGLKRDIGHADFFTLIDVGRALQHEGEGGQHLGRLDSIPAIIAEARYGTWVVVIGQVIAVPALVLQILLPSGYHPLEISKPPGPDALPARL